MSVIQASIPKSKKVIWTVEQDEFLSKVALRHLEEGSTLVNAFEEVATVLGRSRAACGFRFNSVLRKQISNQLQQIKEKRSNNKGSEVPYEDKNEEINWDTVISFMNTQRETINKQQKEKVDTIQELHKLHEENLMLRSQVEKLERNISILSTAGLNIQQLINTLYHNTQQAL